MPKKKSAAAGKKASLARKKSTVGGKRASPTRKKSTAGKKKRIAAKKPPPLRIGWNEYIDLPEWGIFGLRAKVDTGARTSALDAEYVEVRPDGTVAFDLMVQRGKHKHISHVVTPVVGEGEVRSSTGDRDTRIFVETIIRLGGRERRVQFTLVNRKPMRFRVLLGRKTLSKLGVVIDVRRSYLLGDSTDLD